MSQIAKQNVGRTFTTAQVLDSSGIPVTNAVASDFALIKAGGAAVALSSGVAHKSNGDYAITLAGGDLNTVPDAVVVVVNANYAMDPLEIEVRAPKAYDFLHGAGLPDVNVTEINGTEAQQDTLPSGGVSDPLTNPLSGYTTPGTVGKHLADKMDVPVSAAVSAAQAAGAAVAAQAAADFVPAAVTAAADATHFTVQFQGNAPAPGNLGNQWCLFTSSDLRPFKARVASASAVQGDATKLAVVLADAPPAAPTPSTTTVSLG